MPRNTLVINCDIRETRVALIEGGVIAELQIERATAKSTLGNIVLGRVTRVLPGMQAAFIDVGLERAAFLHVEDLIRPVDFEAYLTGAQRGGDEERWNKGAGGQRRGLASIGAADESDEEEGDEELEDEEELETDEDDGLTEEGEPEEEDGEEGVDTDESEIEEEEEEEEEGETIEIESSDDDEPRSAEGEGEPVTSEDTNSRRRRRRRRRRPSRPEQGVAGDPPAAAVRVSSRRPEGNRRLPVREGNRAPVREGNRVPVREGNRAPVREGNRAPVREGNRAPVREGNRAPVREGNRAPVREGNRAPAREGNRVPVREGNRSARSVGRRSHLSSNNNNNKAKTRAARAIPITEVVREGDTVIVQISKEPIGTKGARVTSHISLPGRYVVYLPTVDHVGVSKRIGSAQERGRLREVVETLRPPQGGLIVRTVAEGLTKKSLKTDIGYLVKLWEDVSRKRENAKPPTVLYTELDLVLKTARDLFTDEIESIVIDDKEQFGRLVRFVEMFMPNRVKDIHYYSGDEPIFDAYGIEDEISRALSRKVPLPSGGYLIIDQAEALTAIDVNTGRYVGKGSKDLEETALKTNLEAVEEIAYQLRFRNIGGLVILDLIDMDHPANRERVWRALEQRLAKDKAKTTINRISELGLIEMTRKRTRESLTRTMHETCFYCDGTGQVQSRTTIVYEILRQIRREREGLPGYSVLVNAHPAVVDLMTGEEKAAVHEAERRYMRRIEFSPRTEYHIEQFDLQGK